MWDLQAGLKVIRALQPLTRKFNYHLTLGGGVLNKGESDKDLDLYFLPMGGFDKNKDEPMPDELLKFLDRIWGLHEDIGKDYGNMTYKHAIKFTRRGGNQGNAYRRIDCFIF